MITMSDMLVSRISGDASSMGSLRFVILLERSANSPRSMAATAVVTAECMSSLAASF